MLFIRNPLHLIIGAIILVLCILLCILQIVEGPMDPGLLLMTLLGIGIGVLAILDNGRW